MFSKRSFNYKGGFVREAYVSSRHCAISGKRRRASGPLLLASPPKPLIERAAPADRHVPARPV